MAASQFGSYLAGVVTMTMWRPGGNDEIHVASQSLALRETQPPTAPASSATEQPQLAAAKLDGFESWRRIGDHYLRDGNDISQALAGYSQALDLASDEELAIAPDRDNWLLMALIDARAKERKHARIQQN